MNIIRLIFASGALALSVLPANAEQHLVIAIIAEVPDSALEGVKLGAGDGWADSSDAAAQSALSECNQENNTSHCLIGGSFRYGQCGYVAIGAGVVEGGQRVVCWERAKRTSKLSTPASRTALDKRAAGFCPRVAARPHSNSNRAPRPTANVDYCAVTMASLARNSSRADTLRVSPVTTDTIAKIPVRAK